MSESADSTATPLKKFKDMEYPRTCRYCMQSFVDSNNSDRACRYHPESFTGETAQRWMAPGETKGASDIHNFYNCCGAPEVTAMGCCYTRHCAFGEPESFDFRRPGMGVDDR